MDLTLFDLDNTLLADDSDHLWGRFLVANNIVDTQTYARKNNEFYEQYKAGTLDMHAYQRFMLQPLVDNATAPMERLRERFVADWIEPAVARHTPALIRAHRASSRRIVVITATNRFLTAPIADLLGIEHLIATEPEIVDGRYTGDIAGIPCFGEGKLKRLAAWRETQPETFEHTSFYSDSHNDLPLLRQADAAVAVDPDAQLAAAAQAEGWPIISLRGETAPDFSV